MMKELETNEYAEMWEMIWRILGKIEEKEE